MVNYLEVLSNWMNQPHYSLLILIMIYFASATVDFLAGYLKASLTTGVEFSTKVAQLGIIRKLVTLAVMVLVIPLAVTLPLDFGIYSLTILYIGIAMSEIYSILGHVGIVKDGDKHKNLIGSLISELLETIYKGRGKDHEQ